MNRTELEALRARKRERNYYRLEAATTVEFEYQALQRGHPCRYAFVRFFCAQANELSFESKVSWPSTSNSKDRERFELAIAEAVADVLLDGLYQHSGCAVTLTDIGRDEVCRSEAAFMKAVTSAMTKLLNEKWTIAPRSLG